MTDRYDPHRAHPDTVLAILQQLLDPSAMQSGPRFWELAGTLRDECRLSPATDGELLAAAKAYFAKYVQPHTNVTKEWAVLERIGVEVTGANSGPSGAAAKESREDIAAPGGATSEDDPVAPEPGERPCGCEETEALEKQLAALRARNFELATTLSRIRKLANEPWKP